MSIKFCCPKSHLINRHFLTGVKSDVEQYGYSVVIASEGLKDANGKLYAASDEVDSFGHSQLGGLAKDCWSYPK